MVFLSSKLHRLKKKKKMAREKFDNDSRKSLLGLEYE